MTWRDRLQDQLLLTSPAGVEYQALWRGDQREAEKQLGVFKYPGLKGVRVQDNEIGGSRYELNFWFEGFDNDLVATSFFKACAERGLWTIEHPTLGVYRLQLIFVRENIQPVESGNVTAFTTSWIEPVDGGFIRSTTQLAAEVRQRVFVMQEAATNQYADVVRPGKVASFRAAVDSAVETVTNTLKPLTQTVAEINAGIQSVHRGITTAIVDPALSVIALAGQIQTLTVLPAQSVESIATRLDFYTSLIAEISGLVPDKVDEAGLNDLANQEVVAVSALAAAAEIAIDGEPSTREEALAYLETVNDLFGTLTDNLDAAQTLYADSIIDVQYFSQSMTYNEAVLVVQAVSELLLRRLFDLSVARRFTLERHRAPVEIAITEGVDLDLFISSNNLTGEDILLLPPGREVVIYQ